MDESQTDLVSFAKANKNVPTAVKDEDPASGPAAKSERPAAAPQPLSTLLQTVADRALHFLAHASNETLGACLAGLGVSTYLVLGRVGLVIIGVASGVVLQATWAGVRRDSRDAATKAADEERARETGLELVRRVLDLRKETKIESSEDVRIYANQALDYSCFGPEAAAALDTFTDAVIKDYVRYWYDATIPGEHSFPASCRRTFTAFVLSLSNHLQRKRPADVFLDFVTNASSIIIVFLQELAHALNASPNSSAGEAISAYLQMKPDSSLSYMLDQESQKLKLADISEDLLQSYLDPKSYNCPPIHVFLKEVLAQLVLGYTVTLCSDPAWINDWIVYGLEESETTREVMDIVDAGVEGRTDAKTVKAAERFLEKQSPPQSKKEGVSASAPSSSTSHQRKISKAEEAMDEAMREARRLTEMMIEEDRRIAQEEEKRRSGSMDREYSSDDTTQGAPTPSSSQSGHEKATEEFGTSADGSTQAENSSSPQFTNFDQLVPNAVPTALSESIMTSLPRPVLTLYNANISIFDDINPGERASIKAKPATDYLIQIEPASSAFPGWMIARKYADFETLHEVLKRLSVITGARFNEAHVELPKWRVHTKASLREELERYLTDAVHFQPLAESEGMKRFLEKDQGLRKSPSGAVKSFGWPTPDAFGKFGGDMMNVLTKAPKQVAGGGKAVFGGVAGFVGGVSGNKKPITSQTTTARSTADGTPDTATTASSQQQHGIGDDLSFMIDPMTGSVMGSISAIRQSQDSARDSPQFPREQHETCTAMRDGTNTRATSSVPSSRPASRLGKSGPSSTTLEEGSASSTMQVSSEDLSVDERMNLPPPPSEMPEDYDSPISSSRKSADTFRSVASSSRPSRLTSLDEAPRPPPPPRPKPELGKGDTQDKVPISERETCVAVELMFAVITELYTLSGVWQIRRTLLAAAKTYLLRPGNPQLVSIRDLIQKSLFDNNLGDAGLAHHVLKMRYNTLPTAEESEGWKRDYPEKTVEQKEELRVKAKRLLVTKGMPQALTSVMGAAASGEALGKVFDCLQVPEVSRGLIFGLLLQALRAVTH